jgi:hypothetical protein
MSILKRQRELKKSEKAARKRSKRHGISEPLFQEPTPTILSGGLFGGGGGDEADENKSDESTQETSEHEPDHAQ